VQILLTVIADLLTGSPALEVGQDLERRLDFFQEQILSLSALSQAV
jgi:hypothetical protein